MASDQGKSGMSEGSTGQENANLYLRGAREARRGEPLDPTAVLEVLDVFGEDGLRSYLVGFAEGLEEAGEDPG